MFGYRAAIFVPSDLIGGRSLPHDRELPIPNLAATWKQLAVAEAGYDLCFTATHRTNRPGFDRLRITRLNVDPYGMRYSARCSKERLSFWY